MEIHGHTNRKGGGTKPTTQKGINIQTKGSCWAIIDLDLDHNVNRLPLQHCIMLTCRYLVLVCFLFKDRLSLHLKTVRLHKECKVEWIHFPSRAKVSSLDFKQEIHWPRCMIHDRRISFRFVYYMILELVLLYNKHFRSDVLCAVSTVCFSLSLTLASVTYPSPP